MDVIVERPAALDVHNATVMACVRVPGEGRRRAEQVAEFQTTVQGLLALRDWLEAHDVAQVAMEATGVYWKPVWAVLEDRFSCLLVNARHVKQVPGRKTDVQDAQWLCQLLEAGLLRPSLVPPKPVRTLRNLTRYRKSQIRDRQREMNRLHKIMQDTGIKLDCVVTDMMGKSGRAMLDALVSGPPIRSCSPTSLAASCARRSPPYGRRSRDASTSTSWSWGGSWRTSTTSTRRSTSSRPRSSSSSALSRRRLSCCARSPASAAAPPQPPPPARPPRRQQGHHRGLPLDPHRRLAHAPDRRDLHRPRRRLLRP